MKRTASLSTVAIALFAFCVQAAVLDSRPADSASSPLSSDAITIPVGQKFIMQLETALHSRTTRTGEQVEFTTAADVIVDGQVLIPNKSRIRGTVTKAKRAGRLWGRAEIMLRFQDVLFPDGTVLPIKATITRMGFDPVDPKSGEDPKLKGEAGSGGDAKTVASGTAQGAIIGVLSAGKNGAIYGAAAGAAITIAQIAIQRGPDLDLPRSTMFEARFDEALRIPVRALEASNTVADAPAAAAETIIHPSSETDTATASIPLENSDANPAEVIAASDPVETMPAANPVEPAVRAGASSRPSVPMSPTISVSVRMVQVDAVVRNRAGRMIDNLTADDFRIYEDNVPQEIQRFSRDEVPLAVALVVDRSGSVSSYISELRRIAARALDQLKPKDEVCLFSFADSVDRLEELTADRRRIADGLDRIRTGGGTNITDALHEAIVYLARSAPGRRHAVILVSDNQQTTNPRTSEAETIRLAMEGETVVYSLKTSGHSLSLPAQLPSIILGGGPVNKITQETGGEVINVGSAASLNSALSAVVSRLRMRYSLGYYPSSASQGGAFHSITVRLTDRHGKTDKDYFIHAKRGYYATALAYSDAGDGRQRMRLTADFR